jgi:hypothetical protein
MTAVTQRPLRDAAHVKPRQGAVMNLRNIAALELHVTSIRRSTLTPKYSPEGRGDQGDQDSASPDVSSGFAWIKRRLAVACAVPVLGISGCYVMPVGSHPDGTPNYAYAPLPAVSAPGAVAYSAPHVIQGASISRVLAVRLYPANDLANTTGVLTGQVTNLMSGTGRFQFHYQGELLAGEATRVSGDERKGIASAYGQRGTFARCEYQMNTPSRGAGLCTFSNGAQYQVHIGS